MSTASVTAQKKTYPESTKWVMLLFVCLLYYLVNGFIYTSFNVLLKTIADDLLWTPVERAYVATGISLGTIWFVFVAGIALDKFSVRKLIGSLSVLAGVLVFMRGQIKSSAAYFILMFLYGALVAFFVPAVTKVVGLWFDRKNFAVANGILTASSPLGQITANFFAIPLTAALGSWSTLFAMQGILFAVVGIVFLLFAKERKSIDAALQSEVIGSEDDLGIWKNIKAIAKVPQLWMYIIGNACLLGMVYAGGSQTYIVLQSDPNWGLSAAMPGMVVVSNNIASMICYVLVPLAMAKLFKTNYEKKYKITAMVAGVVSGIAMSIGYGSYNFVGACIGMAIGGICYGAIIPAPKVLMLKLPEVSGSRAGTALGLFLTIERLATTAFIGVIGSILALNPNTAGATLSKMWLLQLISPLMIFCGIMYEKSKKNKITTV